MTKKCFGCGETKGLKAMLTYDCDCGKCDGMHSHSVCKKCYFSDLMSCEMDSHDNNECLKSPTCENHTKTKQLFENWDAFDYMYRPKKGVVLSN